MSNTVTYASKPKSTDPVKQVYVKNPTGYFDLVVNKNKNGKAIRIGLRQGEPRVHIGIAQVDNLIEALKLVKARGVSVSVDDLDLKA